MRRNLPNSSQCQSIGCRHQVRGSAGGLQGAEPAHEAGGTGDVQGARGIHIARLQQARRDGEEPLLPVHRQAADKTPLLLCQVLVWIVGLVHDRMSFRVACPGC